MVRLGVWARRVARGNLGREMMKRSREVGCTVKTAEGSALADL